MSNTSRPVAHLQHTGGDCQLAGAVTSCTIIIALLAIGGVIYYAKSN